MRNNGWVTAKLTAASGTTCKHQRNKKNIHEKKTIINKKKYSFNGDSVKMVGTLR